MNIDEVLKDRLFAEVREVAEVFGYDPRTVRNGIKDGSIPAVKVGRNYRVPVAWIRQQLESGSNAA